MNSYAICVALVWNSRSASAALIAVHTIQSRIVLHAKCCCEIHSHRPHFCSQTQLHHDRRICCEQLIKTQQMQTGKGNGRRWWWAVISMAMATTRPIDVYPRQTCLPGTQHQAYTQTPRLHTQTKCEAQEIASNKNKVTLLLLLHSFASFSFAVRPVRLGFLLHFHNVKCKTDGQRNVIIDCPHSMHARSRAT